MANIGYLAGIEPDVLDELAMLGHRLVPLGTGADNHGKSLTCITKYDQIDLVVLRYHKLAEVASACTTASSQSDVFDISERSETPLLVVTSTETMDGLEDDLVNSARKTRASFVSPEKLVGQVKSSFE